MSFVARGRLAASCLLLGIAMPASAQHVSHVPARCILEATEAGAVTVARRGPAMIFETCASPQATFDVDAPDLPPFARRALDAALDVWACRIVSPVPIAVEARWEPLEGRRLASAGPRAVRDVDPLLPASTWIPSALANALLGRDVLPGLPDIEITFNRDHPTWHVELEAPPDEQSHDFATVALHEIGHGLGLIGSMAVEEGLGLVRGPGGSDRPLLLDRFASGPNGRLLDRSAYPRPSGALADALTSRVFFDGRSVRQATMGSLHLHAPPEWSPGGSYNHLDEDLYLSGTPAGLMTPFLDRGERVSEPGTETCAMLADLGWRLAGDCAGRFGPVEPVAGGIRVEVTGPNPFRRTTTIRTEAEVTGPFRASVVDVLGREVARLSDRSVVPGDTVMLTVDGVGLASGVYVLVVQAGREVVSVPLTYIAG